VDDEVASSLRLVPGLFVVRDLNCSTSQINNTHLTLGQITKTPPFSAQVRSTCTSTAYRPGSLRKRLKLPKPSPNLNLIFTCGH